MSLFELKMPKLGESVTEGTIGKWLKQPGEKVEKYDLLVEVQTDKVNTEIPSPVAGTLKDVKVKEGDTVPIGALLATFETADAAGAAAEPARASGAAGPSAPAASSAPPAASPSLSSMPAPQQPSSQAAPSPQAPRVAQPVPAAVAEPSSNGDIRATPVVRRLAAEHGVDLDRVQGTGLNGRVTRQDVEQYVAQLQSQPQARQAPRAAAAPSQAAQPEMPKAMAGDETMAMSQMRKAIANAMVTSKTTIPHAAAMMEIDWTNVARFRDSVRDSFKSREGFELTYLPFAIKAVTIALRRHPMVNAKWTDQGILKVKAINLGIAISLGDEGLV